MPSAEDSEFQQPAHYFRAPLACWKKSGDSVLSLSLAPFISTDPQIGRGDYDFLVGEGDLIFYSSFCGGKSWFWHVFKETPAFRFGLEARYVDLNGK